MKRYFSIFILLFSGLAPASVGAQTSNMARVIAREMLRVGTDTSKYFTTITHSVTAAATHRQAPTAKAVWDMSVKERMYFALTAPSDTNLTWAKLNSAPWKLDSVFTYEFGSWHLHGFYCRIGGVFSEKPPLFVVATGQSNMLGIDGGGDTTTDRRLVAWDTTAHVWKVAKLGVNPFNSTGANSIAFAFGREVARRENRIVRLVVMAKSSQPIENWFGSGSASIAYNTNLNVIQSGLQRADAILWHQGESNHDGAAGVCNNNTCYADSLYALIRQFRGYTWADENTVFIAGGLYDGAGATQQDRNTALMGLNSDTITTTGFAYATDLDDSGDAVHFSGPALVTLGSERYYNLYRALPNLPNHLAGTGGGGGTIDLTTDVTGVLPVPNGGTGGSSWTANQVITGNGSSALLDAAQFYYNHANDRVGINTSAPAQRLHVVGNGLVGGHLRVNATGDTTPIVIKYGASPAASSAGVEAWNNAGSTLMWRIHRTPTGNNFFAGNGGLSWTGSQNNAFGVNALNALTSGVDNNAFGYRALEAMQSGTKNMAMGTLALLAANTGYSNVGVGYGTIAAVTNGYQNVGIGTQSMSSSGTGVNGNVAVGTQALQLIGGNNNTAVGHLAGQNVGAYNDNVFLGVLAGRNNSGARNVYLGPNQSFTVTESDALRIENTSGTTPLIGGDFSANEVGINLAPASIGAAGHVHGNGTSSATYNLIAEKSDGTDVLVSRDDGRVGVLVTSPQTTLDVSGGTDGVVLPIGTDAQRPSVNGTIRGNSDNGGVEYRVGNQYYRLVANQTPSVSAGAAAGTGATAILFDGSNDLAGGVTLTTGTSATTGTLFTLTFADAFYTGLVIKVTLTAADADAATSVAKYYVSSASTTTFVVSAAAALTDSTEYKLYYQIGQ